MPLTGAYQEVVVEIKLKKLFRKLCSLELCLEFLECLVLSGEEMIYCVVLSSA